MRYIVAVDRTGVHVAPVRSILSPYMHPNFIAEKAIYTEPHGTEYVASILADTPAEAEEAGLSIIRTFFPEALPAEEAMR